MLLAATRTRAISAGAMTSDWFGRGSGVKCSQPTSNPERRTRLMTLFAVWCRNRCGAPVESPCEWGARLCSFPFRASDLSDGGLGKSDISRNRNGSTAPSAAGANGGGEARGYTAETRLRWRLQPGAAADPVDNSPADLEYIDRPFRRRFRTRFSAQLQRLFPERDPVSDLSGAGLYLRKIE